eukprot:768369_1
MIGRKVGVFWPVDEQWYQGTVEEFNAISGEHKLRYKDGDTEWVKIADHTGGSRKKELSPKGKDSLRGGMEQNMNKNLKVEQQQRLSRESSASSGPAVSASVSVSA